VIHPAAIVESGAQLDEGVSVGAFSIIGSQVRIGAGTTVGPHCVISGDTSIGQDNRIFQFSSIGAEPQDLKYSGEDSQLVIGDRNTIREFTTIHLGTEVGGGLTRIGDDNLLMAYVHIAHDCIVGNHTIFANAASLAGHVSVGDHAILGGFSLVHQFGRIGEHSFSGMGSVINKDVPPYCLVSGHYVEAKGINKEGLKRRGFSSESISAVQKAYLKLVKKKGVRDEAYAELEPLAQQHSAVADLIAFIRNSERGIVG